MNCCIQPSTHGLVEVPPHGGPRYVLAMWFGLSPSFCSEKWSLDQPQQGAWVQLHPFVRVTRKVFDRLLPSAPLQMLFSDPGRRATPPQTDIGNHYDQFWQHRGSV